MQQNKPNGRKKTKWPQNIATCSIARPFPIFPNCDSDFENMPSGNPGFKTQFPVSDDAEKSSGMFICSQHWIWGQCYDHYFPPIFGKSLRFY
jgi:hypothetical protein